MTNNEQISDALGRILADISPQIQYFCKIIKNKNSPKAGGGIKSPFLHRLGASLPGPVHSEDQNLFTLNVAKKREKFFCCTLWVLHTIGKF